MIKGDNNTAFRFAKFRVSNFSFDEPSKEQNGYDLRFNPSGIYNETTGHFDLIINFKAFDSVEKDKLIIDMKSVAEFKIEPPCKLDGIPPHFYTNSIPIVFPYLRAFISTLTLQANANVLMLGLINFTNMATPLKENTTVKK